jgi:hypothetical protein
LTFLTDRQRHLVARDDHGCHSLLTIFVERYVRRFRRTQRIGDERSDVRRPFDHVDLFTIKLVHDTLNANTANTDAGSDWIDLFLACRNGYLGAKPWFASDLHDLDGSGLNLGNFLFEESSDQAGIGP